LNVKKEALTIREGGKGDVPVLFGVNGMGGTKKEKNLFE